MVFHSRWSLEEEIPGKILQVPFVKISVEAAVQDPCVQLSVQCVYKGISTEDLCKGSQSKISVQAIYKQISERDLCSLHQVSVQDISL